MPNSTVNLNLYLTDMTTDGELSFDFDRDLNGNFEKIDEACGDLQDSIVEQVNSDWNATSGKAQILNKPTNLVTTATIGALTKYWASGEYTPVAGTLTVVSHNLGLEDPKKAKAEVLLKCIVASNGYSVGDIIPFNAFSTGENFGAPALLLKENVISVPTGIGGIVIEDKSNFNHPVVNLSNWRYVFKIWY